MNQSQKTLAVVLSVVIIVFCLAYAFIRPGFVNAGVNETKTETLQAGDSLSIISSLSSVTVTTDSKAEVITAHLYGTFAGLGEKPALVITRNGGSVTIRAGRQGFGPTMGWNISMKLDVVIPAGFAGDFVCQSSAGSVTVDSDMSVNSFRAHSSAGAVRVKGIKAEGSVEVDSSAGSVETGAVAASSANIHTSAGSVRVASCTAGTIRLQSSAGSVNADGLSGSVDASSSAGSVEIALADVKGGVNATSSAGRVRVAIPANASAEIDISTSAGGASVSNLDLAIESQKHSSIKGRLGEGGPRIYLHSSAGSVEVTGK